MSLPCTSYSSLRKALQAAKPAGLSARACDTTKTDHWQGAVCRMQDVHARRVVAMAERISLGLPVDTDNPPSGPQRYPKQPCPEVKGSLAHLHPAAALSCICARQRKAICAVSMSLMNVSRTLATLPSSSSAFIACTYALQATCLQRVEVDADSVYCQLQMHNQ